MAFDAVTEQAYADLLEREVLVTELIESAGWQALKEAAMEQIEAKRREVLGGRIANHEDYLKVTWWLKGAEEVLALPAKFNEVVNEYRRQMAEVASVGPEGDVDG